MGIELIIALVGIGSSLIGIIKGITFFKRKIKITNTTPVWEESLTHNKCLFKMTVRNTSYSKTCVTIGEAIIVLEDKKIETYPTIVNNNGNFDINIDSRSSETITLKIEVNKDRSIANFINSLKVIFVEISSIEGSPKREVIYNNVNNKADKYKYYKRGEKNE